MRTVVGGVHDEGVVGDAQIVDHLENRAHILVVVDHDVVIRALPASRLADALRLGVGAEMHVGKVHPDKGRLARLVLPLNEVHGPGSDVIVDGFHPLPGERTRVGAHLLADPAEARVHGRVVFVGGLAIHHATGAELGQELRALRIIGEFRLFFGVEVVQVSVELVKAVHGGQVLVSIAEVVFAELAGRIALGFQKRCNGRVFLLQSHRGARQTHLGHAGTQARLAGDERCAAGGAALLGVVVGEDHPFMGDAVDVGRTKAHQSHGVGADVGLADVIAPDDDDVGLGWRLGVSIDAHTCENGWGQHGCQRKALPQ